MRVRVLNRKVDFDAVEAKIQEACIIYEGIEQLCGDPTSMWI